MIDIFSSLSYLLGIILLVFIGARFLGKGSFRIAETTIKSNAGWILLPLLGFVFSSLVNRTTIVTADYTYVALQFLGGIPAQIQAPLQSFLLTGALSLLYLFSLPVILILTPLLFAKAGDVKSFRQFTLAIAIAYVGLALLHLFFPITRPALYSNSGIAPLLYEYPVLGNLTNLLGSKSHSFPSTHTTLIFATFMLLIAERGYKEYSIIVGSIFVLIPLTVMYLGIHWPLDVLGGIALGSISVLIALNLWKQGSKALRN